MQLNNFNSDEYKSNQKNIINIGNSLETSDDTTDSAIYANQITTQTVSQAGGGRAPSSLIQLAISSIPPVNPRFFDLINGIIDNTVPVPANELVPQLLQRVGGGGGKDKYKMKYLKYKQKYIDLKRQIGGNTNWHKVNEELELLPKETFKFIKKQGYFLHIQRLIDGEVFKVLVFGYPEKAPQITFNGTTIYNIAEKLGAWNPEREIVELLENEAVFPLFPNQQLNVLLANPQVAEVVSKYRREQAERIKVESKIMRMNPSLNIK